MDSSNKEKSTSDIAHQKNDRSTYYLVIKSPLLPFSLTQTKNILKSNKILNEFIDRLDSEFDIIWFLASDSNEKGEYERFIFSNGGYMDIYLTGEIRVFFKENRSEKFREKIYSVLLKMFDKGEKQKAYQIMLNSYGGKLRFNLFESLS